MIAWIHTEGTEAIGAALALGGHPGGRSNDGNVVIELEFGIGGDWVGGRYFESTRLFGAKETASFFLFIGLGMFASFFLFEDV